MVLDTDANRAFVELYDVFGNGIVARIASLKTGICWSVNAI